MRSILQRRKDRDKSSDDDSSVGTADTVQTSYHGGPARAWNRSEEEVATKSNPVPPPTHLIYPGGFKCAREAAKASQRLLIINIQKYSMIESHALNKDVWRDPNVEQMVRDSFVFWQDVSFPR